ncbi:MAG TPA: diguanylate cyclase [Burkholderiales bacterium]|nr:diguanylate cyclase [Burkholderiales bacterium]
MNLWLDYLQLWQANWAKALDMPPAENETRRRGIDAPGADWYWEQDEQLRLTFMSSRTSEKTALDLALDLSPYLGHKRWEQPALNLKPEDWDRHRGQLERHERFRDFEIQVDAGEGRSVWLSLSAEPVFDEGGAFRGYRGAGRDTTAQKRAQQLLQLENSVMCCLAGAGSIAFALKGALRAVCEGEGWDCAELWKLDETGGALRLFEHWSAPDIQGIAAVVEAAGDIGVQRGSGMVGSVWQSGKPLWITDYMQQAAPVGDELFEKIGLRAALLVPLRSGPDIVGVLRFGSRTVRAPDERLSDRLSALGGRIGRFLQQSVAEQASSERESRSRRLADLSSDWYWETDASHCFTRLEGRYVTGGDEDLQRRLIGVRRWESGLEIEAGWEVHRALLDARRPFYDVLMWRAMPNGSLRYLSVSGEPVFGADGSFLGYHGVGRDVTTQKQAEQMLRLEHEVARSLAAAEDAAGGLRAAIRAVCEAEGWDSGRYYRLDEASGALRFQDGWCVTEPAVDRFLERSRVVWQFGAAWSGDLHRDLRAHTKSLADGAGARGVFTFAVISEGRTIGVLAFSGESVREPDQRLLQAARVIGSHVGQFLQRKRIEESLRESEARFRSLTEMSSDFYWETDPQHRVTNVAHGANYSAAKIALGVIGKTLWEIPSLSPDEAGWAEHKAAMDSRIPFRDFEFARAMPDGGRRYFSVTGEPRIAADGSSLGYRGVGRDITETALMRERIETLAFSDPLTGLANRTSLAPALEQAIERARRHGARLAGAFIDLDGFKQINDKHGHHAGDQFLVEVARRLRAKLRAIDLVARLGGDEFFVVLEEVKDAAAVESIISKLLAEAVRPYALPGGGEARVSASIGISLFPDDAADAAELAKNADAAMYGAKEAGKNCYFFYSSLSAAEPARGKGSNAASA